MRDPVEFELTRRGVLVGTAAAVAATSMATGVGAQEAASLDAPVMSRVSLTVNGKPHTLDLDARTSLLDLLREHLRPDRAPRRAATTASAAPAR